jgi:hypothetical protein
MSFCLPLPERCSLIQAALWASRGQQPIPDSIFAAAPLWLELHETEADGPLRPLLQALRSEAIPAYGDIVLTTAMHPGDSKWNEHSRVSGIQLIPNGWWWPNVRWQEGEVECDIGLLYQWHELVVSS